MHMRDKQQGADAIGLRQNEFYMKYGHLPDQQMLNEAFRDEECARLVFQDPRAKAWLEEQQREEEDLFEQDEYEGGRSGVRGHGYGGGGYEGGRGGSRYGGGGSGGGGFPRGSRPTRGDEYGGGGNPRGGRPTREGGQTPAQGEFFLRHPDPILERLMIKWGDMPASAARHGGRASGGNGRAPRNGGDMRAPSRASSAQHPRGRDSSGQGRREGPRGNGGRELAPPQSRHELVEEDDEEDDFDD